MRNAVYNEGAGNHHKVLPMAVNSVKVLKRFENFPLDAGDFKSGITAG